MRNFLITIRDLGVEMDAIYKADTIEDAEALAREDYSVELDCSPADVEIIGMEEI